MRRADLEALLSVTPGVPYLRRRSADAPFGFLDERVAPLTGFPARVFLDDPDLWQSRLHPEDRERLIRWPTAIAVGVLQEKVYRFRHRDGAYRWLRDRVRGGADDLAGHWTDVTEIRRSEELLAQRTRALGERVKELRCTHALSNLFQQPGRATDEVLQGVVDLLPPAWQYPEVTWARLRLDGRTFQTPNFRSTSWRQSHAVIVDGADAGTLEVGYLEDRPAADEGPFLREESELLASVASRLGRWLELRRAAERLRHEGAVNGALAGLAQALLRPHTIEEISDLVLEHAQRLTGSPHGYVGYVDPETGHLVCPTLTREIWAECRVAEKSPVFETSGGLTGWVLAHRRALVTNDPAGDPRSTGTPPGHVSIERFLSVPARVADRLVGQISLANAGRDYSPEDLQVLERLATLYALAVERMWAEEELRGARARAEAASRAKGELLANVSHELRTPLNGVIGAVDLVRDLTDPSEEQKRYLAVARASADRLTHMIDRLLDLAGLDHDSVPLEVRPFDLPRLVRQTVDAHAPGAAGKGLALSLDLDPRVPSRVRADPARLRQVLEILLENALKFTETGSVTVRVEPVDEANSPESRRRDVRFSVSDTGIGLPAEGVDHLFRPFTQLDGSSTRRHGGAGLGLAIAAKLVEKMGGRIAAEGQPGLGSTFAFTVPLRLPKEPRHP